MASNALLGKLILALTLSVFAYYFFWVGVLPFMVIDSSDGKHCLSNLSYGGASLSGAKLA